MIDVSCLKALNSNFVSYYLSICAAVVSRPPILLCASCTACWVATSVNSVVFDKSLRTRETLDQLSKPIKDRYTSIT